MQPVSKIYIKENISEHEAVAGTATPNQHGGHQTVGHVDYSNPPRMSSRAPASSALRSSRDETEAQYQLAKAYSNGEGVDQDFEKAADLYRQAAESGHLQAAIELADLYALGKGVEQDFKRALYWQMRHSLIKVMGTPVAGASLIDGSDEMISCLPDALAGFQEFEFVSHLNLCNFRASDAGFSVIDRLVRFNSTLEWIGMSIPDSVDSGHVNATLKKLAESIRETIPTHRPPKLQFDQDEIDDSLLIEIDQLLGQNQAIFDLCRKLEKNPPVNSDELPPEVLKMLADQLVVRNIKDGQTKEATEAAVDEFLMSAQYQRLHQATGQFSSRSNSANS